MESTGSTAQYLSVLSVEGLCCVERNQHQGNEVFLPVSTYRVWRGTSPYLSNTGVTTCAT